MARPMGATGVSRESDEVSRIEWVIRHCRLLAAIGHEFERTHPFQGLIVGTAMHLEAKGVALLLTLRRGGARVVSTGNLNSTQVAAIDYLNTRGVETVGGPTTDPAERLAWIDRILAERPHLIVDNGGDMYVRWLDRPYASLLGGTEQTGSGRVALVPLRERLARPILVIDDSPIKQFVDDRHAVGQSTVESFLRLTNLATNGRSVVVVGYGRVGRGVAHYFQNNHARVSVLELDPVLELEALWEGFAVPPREVALSTADIVVTATGASGVVGAADLDRLRDGAILLNVGHLPNEIDLQGMLASGLAAATEAGGDGVTTLRLRDGRSVVVLGDGHMVNLAGPRPIGNSIEAMDIGFSLQARCLEAVARGELGVESCVAAVPRSINERVARGYVELASATRMAGSA